MTVKLVAENSEATLAFRALAANVIRMVAGDTDQCLLAAMHRCLDVMDESGGPLQLPDFAPIAGDEDEAINLIVQGVLRMVANVLESFDVDDPGYQAGLSTLTLGVVKLQLQSVERGGRRR